MKPLATSQFGFDDDWLRSVSPDLRLRPIDPSDLLEVCTIEHSAHEFAWGHEHFTDCLSARYRFEALTEIQTIAGYYVAMSSLDEVHLLNITVAPGCQRRGFGRLLMHAMMRAACAGGASSVWLEVRPQNTAALALYKSCEFEFVARRKDYYPAKAGGREDAWVMRWNSASLLGAVS